MIGGEVPQHVALTARRVIEEADQALARHRAALEAGADPQLVTRWMAETQARRAEALTKARPAARLRKLTKDEIRQLTVDLGDIRQTLINADPADKADVYRQLGLRLVYHPGKQTVRAETNLDPHSWGYRTCPRGELRTIHPPPADMTADTGPRAGCTYLNDNAGGRADG